MVTPIDPTGQAAGTQGICMTRDTSYTPYAKYDANQINFHYTCDAGERLSESTGLATLTPSGITLRRRRSHQAGIAGSMQA